MVGPVARSFNDWGGNRDYPASDAPFRNAETYGPVPFAHDLLDQVRMNWRRTPEAEYPDGYLGNINPRRGDRLLDGLKQRQAKRSPWRGVHVGERIDPINYLWPDEFNLMSGIVNQATTGQRYVSPVIGGALEDERIPTDGRWRSAAHGARHGLSGVGSARPQDPDRVSVLRSQAPAYSTGRGNPGMAVAPRSI